MNNITPADRLTKNLKFFCMKFPKYFHTENTPKREADIINTDDNIICNIVNFLNANNLRLC